MAAKINKRFRNNQTYTNFNPVLLIRKKIRKNFFENECAKLRGG